MSKSEKTIEELEKHAAAIRAEVGAAQQSDVLRAAVEAGYLTALADGEMDATERETLVKAAEILSVGAVLEWEVETLLEEADGRIGKDGAQKRAEHVGAALAKLGQAEAGLLLAAVVARATKKVDKTEAEMLKAVGKGAGLSNDQVAGIVKRATALF